MLDEIVQCVLAAELGLLSLVIDPVLLGGGHFRRLRPCRTERELEEDFWLGSGVTESGRRGRGKGGGSERMKRMKL